MRTFLCSFEKFSLAIPINFVSSVMLMQGNQNTAVEYDDRFRNTYISLPLLFNVSPEKTKHGIILKNDINDIDDEGVMEDRNILLINEIESENEIPEDKIYSIPKILNVLQFSSYVSGIIFSCTNILGNNKANLSNKNIVFIINPEQLVKNINKELKI